MKCSSNKVMHSHALSGFTLIELLMTIAIASILLGIAIPSFNGIIKNSQLSTNANQIIAAYSYARSEAIARGENIHVKKDNDAWIVTDRSSSVLQKFEIENAGIEFNFTPEVLPEIIYSPSGFRIFSNITPVVIQFCDSRRKGRQVKISASGMTELEQECS